MQIDLELGKELFNSHSSQRLQVNKAKDVILARRKPSIYRKSKKIHFDALTAELDYRERLGELVETHRLVLKDS